MQPSERKWIEVQVIQSEEQLDYRPRILLMPFTIIVRNTVNSLGHNLLVTQLKECKSVNVIDQSHALSSSALPESIQPKGSKAYEVSWIQMLL